MYLSKQEIYFIRRWLSLLVFLSDPRALGENSYPARLCAQGKEEKKRGTERANGTFEMPLKRRSLNAKGRKGDESARLEQENLIFVRDDSLACLLLIHSRRYREIGTYLSWCARSTTGTRYIRARIINFAFPLPTRGFKISPRHGRINESLGNEPLAIEKLRLAHSFVRYLTDNAQYFVKCCFQQATYFLSLLYRDKENSPWYQRGI